jgi:hypothetical protein
MTTFILHGGKTSIDSPQNNAFFAEFTKLVDKPEVKILLCYWSREKEKWGLISERDIKRIVEGTTKKVMTHLVESPTDLFNKIDEYDVLYVAGGEAHLLEPYFKDLKGLKEKLTNKVYAGSSMGTFLVSENYVLSLDRQDTSSLHKGVGLLPFQILCHWNVETKKAQKLELLKASKTPILVLNEMEYVTIYN